MGSPKSCAAQPPRTRARLRAATETYALTRVRLVHEPLVPNISTETDRAKFARGVDKQDLIQQNRLPRRRLVRRMPVEDPDVGRRVGNQLLAARFI